MGSHLPDGEWIHLPEEDREPLAEDGWQYLRESRRSGEQLSPKAALKILVERDARWRRAPELATSLMALAHGHMMDTAREIAHRVRAGVPIPTELLEQLEEEEALNVLCEETFDLVNRDII